MEKYKFTVDGAAVTVYPSVASVKMRDEVRGELSDGELAVLLYPHSSVDFLVDSFDKNNREPREPYLILAALSCFFDRVRSYPSMILEIAFRSDIYELMIGKEKEYNFSVNCGKCKILYSNSIDFRDGITLLYYAVECGGITAAVVCEDSELLDDGRLLLLLERLKDVGVSSVMALSRSLPMRMKIKGDMTFYSALQIGAFLLYYYGILTAPSYGECYTDGQLHRLSYSGRSVIIYPDIKYIS